MDTLAKMREAVSANRLEQTKQLLQGAWDTMYEASPVISDLPQVCKPTFLASKVHLDKRTLSESARRRHLTPA